MTKKFFSLFILVMVCVFAVTLSGCSNRKESPKTFDLTNYSSTVTHWGSEDVGWQYGGFVLDIIIDEMNDISSFVLELHQSAPASRIAYATMDIKLSDITSNEINLNFDDDAWGHSGDVELILSESEILLSIRNVKSSGSVVEAWGFYEVENVSLTRNQNIVDCFNYTEEEYNILFPEQIDTSKASGILKSLKVSEEEFKLNCEPLYTMHETNGILSSVWFYDTDLLGLMQDYPADYINRWYKIHLNIDSNFMSSDGYRCYSKVVDNNVLYIYDFRDDIYYPTLASGDEIEAYVIYRGLSQDSNTCLKFFMIAVDKL